MGAPPPYNPPDDSFQAPSRLRRGLRRGVQGQLGSGADRLQYRAGVGADDRVERFDPARDRLELWGLAPGSRPTLSLQPDGANTLLTWETNRVTFSNQSLTLPAPVTLPAWIVMM